MRVLYNKTSSQRNQDCSGEVVELVDSAASYQEGEGDSKFLGQLDKWPLTICSLPYRLNPHMCSNKGACRWCQGGNWDIPQGKNCEECQGEDWDSMQVAELGE